MTSNGSVATAIKRKTMENVTPRVTMSVSEKMGTVTAVILINGEIG